MSGQKDNREKYKKTKRQKTKRQQKKKTKRQKDKKTKDKAQKEFLILRRQVSFALLLCFSSLTSTTLAPFPNKIKEYQNLKILTKLVAALLNWCGMHS